MAATLTGKSELTYLSFPIMKFEETDDGNLMVYGKATDGSVDSDEQIVDPDWSGKAISDWLASGANVRVQHNPQRDPAGVGIEVDHGSDGATYVKSLVVEPVAQTLVRNKALRAYSVGIARPKIVRDSVARGGRIVDGEIVEISLVDRPANKNCGISLVKADNDGNAEWVGKMFGNSDLLQKAATVEDEVTLPASSTFSPADLAKLLEARRIAEKAQAAGTIEKTTGIEVVIRADGSPETVDKRQMDPDVGGGTDRDNIPAADFAGRDRSFPIVKPGDVSDAANSIGRAGPDNYSSDKLRENIIRIANRKGPQFVAQLPDSWRENGNKAEGSNDLTVKAKKAKKKGKTPFEGAHPAFSGDHQPPHDANDPSTATKGAKDCPKCGKSYHADSKLRKCEKCGADLPMANKDVAEPHAIKKDKKMCAGCGANIDAKHAFCPECGNDQSPAANKGHDFTCLGCGRELDDDEKYCPGCGKQNPGYEGMNSKSSKPTPGAGAVGSDSVQPVPAHREPDGVAVEAFEHDAGLPTDPDANYIKTATRLKSVGVPTNLGALHDLLCPGYHPADVAKSYPESAINLADMDLSYWQSHALDAATRGTLEEATKATALWQHADSLKGTDPRLVDEIRHEAHKAFRDANTGPASFPRPTELSPSKFNRPYLTAGHASQSPGASGPNSHSVPSSSMDAASFQRGPLTAGHAADSPANKSTGTPTLVDYSGHLKNAAASAMSAMHDHISQTFPDLCPMGAPANHPNPVPSAVKSDASNPAEPEPVAEEPKAKKHKKAKVEKAATAADPVLTELLQQVSALTAQVETLTKNVDALGDLPDPRVTAFKGVGQNNLVKSAAAPAATVAETAERTQLMMMRELESQFRTSPDPAQREAAWNALVKMRGLPG